MSRMLGKQSMVFQTMPCITGYGNVVGKKEKEGPLGELFDAAVEEEMAGGDNWEEAESNLQVMAADMAIKRAGIARSDLRYLLAGDLLGQLIATSFGMKDFGVPLFGLYGACSTMGEAASLGAVLVDGGYADRVMALTSSHFASAEKELREPEADVCNLDGDRKRSTGDRREKRKKQQGYPDQGNYDREDCGLWD